MSLPKMDPKWKAEWVKALRSGEFEQGTDVLFNPHTNTYCCLGVLECLVKDGEVPEDQGYLSVDVANEVGIPKDDGDAVLGSPEEKLVHYNDDGRSFRWIAAYIERYL